MMETDEELVERLNITLAGDGSATMNELGDIVVTLKGTGFLASASWVKRLENNGYKLSYVKALEADVLKIWFSKA